MKITHYKTPWQDDHEWKSKRLAYFANPENKDAVQEGEQQTSIAEERLAAHRGKSPEQAFQDIDNMLSHKSHEMKGIMNEWNKGFSNKVGRGINRITLGLAGSESVKSKLRNHLHDVAKTKIEKVANQHGMSAKEAGIHAKNSIALHTEVIRSAGVMQEDLTEAIAAEEALLGTAQKGLKMFKDFRVFGDPINKAIKNFTELRTMAANIAEESEKKIDDKGEKTKRIQTLEEGIMTYVQKKNPDMAGVIGAELKRWVLSGDENEKHGFFKALSEAGISEGSPTRESINQMARRLFEGEVSKPGLRSYLGSFTRDEVRQYFLTKAVQEGSIDTNIDGESTEERIDRLNKHALGQRVNIAGNEYYLIKKEPAYKGFLLKSVAEQGVFGYITNEKSTPVFTKENADQTFAAPIGLAASKNPEGEEEKGIFQKSINFDAAPLAISKVVNKKDPDSEKEPTFTDHAETALKQVRAFVESQQ